MGLVWTALSVAVTRGTSELDWCEPNYVVSKYIAEFYNTISNILFFITPPILIALFHPYAKRISWGCHLVWCLLLVVGFGSAYFHATLSLAGQLMDEFGILWVFNAALGIWIPKKYLPHSLRDQHLVRYQVLVILFTLLGTLLGCLYPWINCLVLMTFGIPASAIMYRELRLSTEPQIKILGKRTMLLWLVAVSIWISDRILCALWLAIGFPYLHSIWHLLISVTSYGSIVFFAYVDAKSRFGDCHPELKYWPPSPFWERSGLGIPYVYLGTGLPTYVSADGTVIHRPVGLCGPLGR